MKVGMLLLLFAIICAVERASSQLCYTCNLVSNSSETEYDLDVPGLCGTVSCSNYGGCSIYQLSAQYTEQGMNKTDFITYRDCGTRLDRCRPITDDTLSDQSALAVIVKAKYSTINYEFGKACDCTTGDLCNSATMWRLNVTCVIASLSAALLLSRIAG